jgi:hypothetical protein
MNGLLPTTQSPHAYVDGQCILTLSSSKLLLSPRGGNLIRLPDLPVRIQPEGASLAVTGLSTSTLYYIYATAAAGGVAIEASATAYAVDDETGLYVKSGDRTRRLVGMARTTSGGAFADSATQRFVRSFFHDPGYPLSNAFTANRTTTSSSFVEINTEIRIEALVWSGETWTLSADGEIGNTLNGSDVYTCLAIDGTTAEDTSNHWIATSNAAYVGMTLTLLKSGLSEGYHYATLIGKRTTGAGTSSWLGSSTAGERVALRGFLRR